MAGEDKNLKEMIADSFEEQNTANQESKSIKTNSELSESQSDETNSGETPDYESGIDISDVPEQDRPRLRKYLKEKAGLLEKGYQPKFQKVAQLEKAQEELTNLGYTPEAAMEILRQNRNKTTTQVVTEQKKNLRELDKLIESAPYEQRSQLENFRKIILEETDVPSLRKELDEIKSALGMVVNSTMTIKKRELNSEVDSFKDKFGDDFIEKYRDKIVDVALKNPNIPLMKIIKFETPDDEFEQAILYKKSKVKPLTKEKRNAISSDGSGVSSSDKIDVKGSSIKDLLTSGFTRK